MSLNETPMAERTHIGFFGLRNAGKSSLVNRITNQQVSVVSDVRGTTTDPVRKSMELLPLGPVTIIDTPGYDDEGALGELRIARTKEVLSTCDIAVLVTEGTGTDPAEKELLDLIRERQIPCVIARNKTDLAGSSVETELPQELKGFPVLSVSAESGEGVETLKNAIAGAAKGHEKETRLVADLIHPGDTVVLVIPIDTSAPKGRLILPQQQTIRDLLEGGCSALCCRDTELAGTLAALAAPPKLVITDSQVFRQVDAAIPADCPLTSFSILLAASKKVAKTAANSILSRIGRKLGKAIARGLFGNWL